MNFIAHYYPGSHIPSPEFHLGLVLPDMVRISNKTLRLKPIAEPLTLLESPMQVGMNLHFDSDHFFHNTEFFKQGSTRLTELARSFPFQQITRSSFIGHILLELLLDRWLLIHQPAQGHSFYKSLSEVNPIVLSDLFNSQEKQPHLSDFKSFLGKFIGYRYLLLYPKDDELAYALTRIYFRATGLLPTLDTPLLIKLIRRAEQALTPDFEAFLPQFNAFFQQQAKGYL